MKQPGSEKEDSNPESFASIREPSEVYYNMTVLDHAINPRNVEKMDNPDAVGSVGETGCGDLVKIWIKVKEERLVEIKFDALGCPALIAACSMMTEMVCGKSLDDAHAITGEEVCDALGGVPKEKSHCGDLAVSSLRTAIMNYVVRSVSQGPSAATNHNSLTRPGD
ncbi:iron-sulfur cluster assembly scaffold protein [Candidatus Hydrogenedentota bacterium]